MSRIFVFLLVIAMIYSTYAETNVEKCGPHERFTTCGTMCERSCQKPEGEICPEVCVEKCQCIGGYLRSDDYKCVLPEDCSKKS